MRLKKFRSRNSFFKWYSNAILTGGGVVDHENLVKIGEIFEAFLLYNTYDIEVLAEFVFFCDVVLVDKIKYRAYSKLLRERIKEAKKIAFPTLKDLLEE